MKKTLTDRALKALKPALAGKRVEVMDAIVPGLTVRVTDKGRKTFALIARYPGSPNPTRRALGEYGAIKLEDARKKARAWLELIARGIDPKIEADKDRREALQRQKDTFAAVAGDFAERHLAKLSTGEEVKAAIDRHFVSRWAPRPVSGITRREVIEVLEEIADRGTPYAAHHALAYLRKLFNWAIARDAYGIEFSPCDRIRPTELIGRRVERTRTLSDAELRALWQSTEQLAYPFGPLIRLLILTGQRRDEVADMSWSELDLGKALWTIPAERMKMDGPHLVPLAPESVSVLQALPKWKGEYVFSTTAGKRPVSGFSKAKDRAHALMLKTMREGAAARGEEPEKIELPEWRFHDLRRTARTHFSAIPAQDLVRELVIAHARPGLHRVYDQHAYLDEKRELLEAWAARLRSIVEPPPANVVPIRVRAEALA